jgi:hypothetical protein
MQDGSDSFCGEMIARIFRTHYLTPQTGGDYRHLVCRHTEPVIKTDYTKFEAKEMMQADH